MGLADWINRYIVELEPGKAGEPGETGEPGKAPAGWVDAPRLVPTERTARDLIPPARPSEAADPDIEGLLAEARRAPAPAASAPAAAPSPTETGPAYPLPPWLDSQKAAAQDGAAVAAAQDDGGGERTPPEGTPVLDPDDDGQAPPIGVDQVYAASRLGKPAHGFSLERIAGMLADPRLARLDEGARAGAVAVLLEGASVKLEGVVEDAATRDQALDRFETFLEEKLALLREEVSRENARLEEEIERFVKQKREQIARNEVRVIDKRRELARFRRVKRAEEDRLFEVVRPFTARNPVTRSGPARPPAPAPAAPALAADASVADTGTFRAQPRPPKPATPATASDDPYAAVAERLRRERGDP